VQLTSGSCAGVADFQFRARLPTSKFVPPGWDAFQVNKFSNPEAFEMILEILTIVCLIQCTNMVWRLIERRNDVLYYVSKSDAQG
jgi:hypothetical protein